MVPGARLWSLRLLLLGNATCDATMCGRLQQRAGPRADSPKAEQRSAKRAEHSKTASIYCAPAVLLLRCEIGSSTGRAGLPSWQRQTAAQPLALSLLQGKSSKRARLGQGCAS